VGLSKKIKKQNLSRRSEHSPARVRIGARIRSFDGTFFRDAFYVVTTPAAAFREIFTAIVSSSRRRFAAPQDEVLDPHGEERVFARLEP
jgi:hypothetical protein